MMTLTVDLRSVQYPRASHAHSAQMLSKRQSKRGEGGITNKQDIEGQNLRIKVNDTLRQDYRSQVDCHGLPMMGRYTRVIMW